MQANDILVGYVNRLYLVPSMKWSEVDIIYVPINVWSIHWVLRVVHLTQMRIFVYDSLVGINIDTWLKGAFIPLTKLLPCILLVASYYGETDNPKSEQ